MYKKSIFFIIIILMGCSIPRVKYYSDDLYYSNPNMIYRHWENLFFSPYNYNQYYPYYPFYRSLNDINAPQYNSPRVYPKQNQKPNGVNTAPIRKFPETKN